MEVTRAGVPPPVTTSTKTPLASQPTSFANGRYEVKKYLGEGGKKKVYLAQDTLLDREVAFALIKTEGLDEVSRMAKRVSVAIIILFSPLLGLQSGVNSAAAQASSCTISSDPSTIERIVQVNVDCAGAKWIKLSESSDFNGSSSTSVVRINIDSVAADATFADISVNYQNGTSGGEIDPFHVQPAQKTVNLLAVRYVFEDSSGNIAGLPKYMTDTWLNRTVFDKSVGFDNQHTANSIRVHIQHNTYGRVDVGGQTYPNLVRLSLDRYFDPLDQSPGNRNVLEGILEYIAAHDPQFLGGKEFDFVVGFSPDHYSVVGHLEALSFGNLNSLPSHPSIQGFILTNVPFTSSSALYGTIVDEQVTSVSSTTLATKYDPTSIEGVWLASDLSRTGMNYFSGGQINGTRGDRYLALGSPLPSDQTAVVVTYTPSAANRIKPSTEVLFPPDTLILANDRWHARYMHELYHAISPLISFNGLKMGDLYKDPARLERYDLMDDGEDNRQLDDLLGDGTPRYYYEPSYLSGYSKLASEFISPLSLPYGQNASSIRLHKMEEDDFSDTNERIKLIKIPLRPRGDPGLQSMLKLGNDSQYAGEEYLLLEWRYGGPLGGTERNFDAYLPSEGLVITHVIQNPHYNGTNSTGFGSNIVRVVDATPPPSQVEGYTDTPDSPALFGPDSGVYTYQAGTFWQETATGQLAVEYLLSEGAGNKTVYAKFKDDLGNALGQDQTTILLNDNSTATDRIPSMLVTSPSDNSVVTADPTWVRINIDAPNDVVRTFVYHDGAEFFDTLGQVPTDFIRLNEFSGEGFHTTGYVAYDRAGISFGEILPFYINQSPPFNQLPLATAGPDQSLSDANNDGFVTAVLDARQSLDPDGIISTYAWYDGTGELISASSVHALTLGGGAHSFTLQVTDNLGGISADSMTVLVAAQGLQPPVAPSSLVATVLSTPQIYLTWSDNSSNEAGFDLERSPGSAVWNLIAALGAGSTSYSDTSVVSNSTYHYRVKAHNGGGASPYSNVVLVTTPLDTTPPVTPSGLSATAVDGSVSLDWTDHTESDLAGYNVKRATSSGGASPLLRKWTTPPPARKHKQRTSGH